MLNLLWALVFWVIGAFLAYAFFQFSAQSPQTKYVYALAAGFGMAGMTAFPLGLLSGHWDVTQSLVALVLGAGIGFGLLLLYQAVTHLEELQQDISIKQTQLIDLQTQLSTHKNEIFALDASALYFGDIVKFLNNTYSAASLVIPRLCIKMVQEMAQSPAALSHAQGELAVKNLERLQHECVLPWEIFEDPLDAPNYQLALLDLLKQKSARLISGDTAITREISAQGMNVVDLNDVALALKPNRFVGQTTNLFVREQGIENKQGIGYLQDGTKVIVEGGDVFAGRQVHVKFMQIYETVAGQLIQAVIE